MNRRSHCPISFALELFGDRWTLLVIRDLALMGKSSYTDLLCSDEGIATNILAERLARLEQRGIIRKERDTQDRRRSRYRLTEAGLDLIPVLVEIIVWGANNDDESAIGPEFVREAETDRAGLLARLRADGLQL
ncbi:MAG: helix-turn-helix transcriptional regulator [Deltaproteobacteria bacterium]|nr:helix-turn-helix transcriptional regulator [Deltaproteobacteria bacterium]